MIVDLLRRIQWKLIKLQLQPIRVFCMHHVSDVYEESYMWDGDWTQTEQLKRFVERLRSQGYIFISLAEAKRKLEKDLFRCKKYAVLTADDGFKTLLNILPWLKEQQIPITLFVNPKYMLEDEIGDNVQMRLDQTQGKITSDALYLKLSDIKKIESPYVSFAYHGYEHLDEYEMDKEEFLCNVDACVESMHETFFNVVPFYAHTYGHAKPEYDEILKMKCIVPVYVSYNKVNYYDSESINRELISNERLLKGALK